MSSSSSPGFRVGRSRRQGREGETLLASLARSGWPRLVRSIRYHRPRGPVCGTGDCTGCLVRVNGRPNVRACRYLPQEGDAIRTENSWPSPGFDLFGGLDLLFPHGIDTLKGLRRPRWATPIYQRVVRRLAGYGRSPAAGFRQPSPPVQRPSAPVVIVGAGRAGRDLAQRLVREGVAPLLLERESSPPELPGARVVAGVTAVFLPPPATADEHTLLAVGGDATGFSVSAPQVVVATGAYDGPLLFEGSDRPGVITADLALRCPELPFGRAAVVGGGPRALAVLDRFGPRIGCVVAPDEIRPEVVARATELGIPLYPRSRVVRVRGRRRVRRLELAARGDGGGTSLSVDAVVLAHRRLPNAQLLFQAGVPRQWHGEPGAHFPELSPEGRTPVPGLWAIGSAARPPGEGPVDPERLVRALLGASLSSEPTWPAPAVPGPGLSSYYKELLAEPRRGKWVVCPCEDVLLEEVEEATRRGFRGLEVVKRYTGAGTGLCQGRFCLPDLLLVLSVLEARTPKEVGTITQRPPLVPTPLGTLASLAPVFDREEVA